MFDFIRRHTKLMMALIFVLVIPSFAFFGIEGYTRFNQDAGKVASVDGKSITQAEWDSAHRQTVDRIRAANPGIDAALLDTPELKYASLEQLVRERVLAAAAADGHLAVSDQRLAEELQQDPLIASLRRADGSLDIEQYDRLVAPQGVTHAGFEARVRAKLSADQVLTGVLESELIGAAQSDVTMGAFLERREASVLRLTPADFASKITPGDADVEAFYKANLARYQVPESARIEYVVLDLDTVKKSVAVTVNEDDARAYYDKNAAKQGKPEERRASHIMINAPRDAPADERAKAREKAAKLLEQLRKSPGTFAELARKSSQDDASAKAGGDLGFFQRDKGVIPAIAQAAFALYKSGDISDVVESDYGYHIVQLTGIKAASLPPFEQLRAQFEEQLRTEQAQKQFGELADTFTETVFQQFDSLQPVADKLKLTIQTADGVRRTPAPGAAGVLGNAKFLSALFATDSLDKKRNTEAVEAGTGQLVAGRVVQYSPAHARPLDEVRDQVRAAFIAERGAQMARQEGQERLKAWTAQPSSATGLPAAITLSRDAMQNQPAALVEAVLRADPAKLPLFVGVDLGAQGYAIARVDKVLPKAEQTAEEASQSRNRYRQAWTVAEARQYYELLKARYKAAITAPDPAVKTITLKPQPQ